MSSTVMDPMAAPKRATTKPKAAKKTPAKKTPAKPAAKAPAPKRDELIGFSPPDRPKTPRKPAVKAASAPAGLAAQPSAFAPNAKPAALKKADFVQALRSATTMDLVTIERQGVPAALFEFLARRLSVSLADIFRITGAPRSTALRKISQGARLDGAPGQAALGMTRLLAKAQELAAQSTHPDAATFDTARWLGEWIRKPQPALGGRRPEELLDTPTGQAAVMRVLGAMESGASL